MRTSIQVSMFQDGFPEALADALQKRIPAHANFAFVASEFEMLHEKTDKYFHRFLSMFTACGIEFAVASVVDGRMSAQEMRCTIEHADVIWLSGGDTPTQFGYLEKYDLLDVLRAHEGVFIGMSAGAINMAETAVCTLSCGHAEETVYTALGFSPYTVEPHFDADNVPEDVLQLSKTYVVFGLCDEAAILYDGTGTQFIGKVFCLHGGRCEQLSDN